MRIDMQAEDLILSRYVFFGNAFGKVSWWMSYFAGGRDLIRTYSCPHLERSFLPVSRLGSDQGESDSELRLHVARDMLWCFE